MMDPRYGPHYGWGMFAVISFVNFYYWIDKFYYLYVITILPGSGMFTRNVMMFRDWFRCVIQMVSWGVVGFTWALALIPFAGRWTMLAKVLTGNLVV